MSRSKAPWATPRLSRRSGWDQKCPPRRLPGGLYREAEVNLPDELVGSGLGFSNGFLD